MRGYIPNKQAPRVNFTLKSAKKMKAELEKEIKDAQIRGFKIGMMSAVSVLNDVYWFEDEELQDVMEKMQAFMMSIVDGNEDVDKLNKEVEAMTGINILKLWEER